MRGPSSSHTAGSYHIGCMVRSLFGEKPDKVEITFDPDGSYARIYRQQGVDLAFAMGIMQLALTDDRFFTAVDEARQQNIAMDFRVSPLPDASHPNSVAIRLTSGSGKELMITAKSTGGGSILIDSVNTWPVACNGKSFEYFIVCHKPETQVIKDHLLGSIPRLELKAQVTIPEGELLWLQSRIDCNIEISGYLQGLPKVKDFMWVPPVFFVQWGELLFANAADMIGQAEKNHYSLGQVALKYEAQLLGRSEAQVLGEIGERFEIMRTSAAQGFQDNRVNMQLLSPSAKKIQEAESQKNVAVGGLHTRAAARALAVLHSNNSGGVVCAAPTGGAAGVIPGVVLTLVEEMDLDTKQTRLALLAAAAIGLIIARRATFAAETAGCQVEIGAAGSMAAAAVVEAAGGSAKQAVEAAAISLQNTMGSVCDLVQGMCEIPCHTRNAVAASNAFVCADLIMGGYQNPIPLDETIDAVLSVGKMLPVELRCTTLGGLAQTPSALALKKKVKKDKPTQ